MATTTAVRPVQATTAADLAVAHKLPEPPADPAGLAGWEREVRQAAYCANPVWLAGRVEQADKRSGEVLCRAGPATPRPSASMPPHRVPLPGASHSVSDAAGSPAGGTEAWYRLPAST